MDTAKTEIDSLREVLQQASLESINNVPVVIAPPGFIIKPLPELMETLAPLRITRAVVAGDIRGFIDYVKLYRISDTHLYASTAENPKLLARIDDHQAPPIGGVGAGNPSKCTHSCLFGCPTTVELKRWSTFDRKPMSQIEFAEHIEDNLKDIIDPAGAELLSAALSLQDHGEAKFASAVRLSDGRVQFSYEEKNQTGQIKFPERMTLALPIFEGFGSKYPIEAKLRYRIKRTDDNAGLSLWYEMNRPDLALRQAYEDLVEFVSKALDNTTIIRAL